MKLQSYQSANGPRTAVQLGDQLLDLHDANPDIPCDICEIFQRDRWLDLLRETVKQGGTTFPIDSVTLLPPIPTPQKIVCIGLNYADHAAETGDSIPDKPVVFNKFPTALAQNGDTISLPRVSQQVDYEAELVVVIGKKGKDISRENAWEHVAGYCCGNDVSARDWQFLPPARQWFIGKTFDGFAPIGPCLTTVDEIPQPVTLDVSLRLNGQTMQHSNTRQFIFDIPTLLAWVSQVCTLVPGDLIFTGTPPGVGIGRKPPVFLHSGDVCEVEIEGLGVLKNTFR
ncbi:MAG: fumarylacetoacetate hydrolase family protein [Planctomycetia bacterium]|nr:fumarylacetoacetate hydrolase family protein [Planctomycetia bacterium]